MVDTIEYTSTNLNTAQRDFCRRYEDEHENNQARVEVINPDGTATVHLHGPGRDPRVVTVQEDGKVKSDQAPDTENGGY